MTKIEVTHIEHVQVGVFKRAGNITKLKLLLSKGVVDDLRAIWKR